MTLEEAVEVLNRERHLDEDRWNVLDGGAFGNYNKGDFFTAFEAIAIAEKYERDRMQQESEAAFERIGGVTSTYSLTLAEIRELIRLGGGGPEKVATP